VTVLPVLLLAGLATIVRCLACTTRKLGPTCLAVGAVFVARVDLLWLLHCETVLLDPEIFVEFITTTVAEEHEFWNYVNFYVHLKQKDKK